MSRLATYVKYATTRKSSEIIYCHILPKPKLHCWAFLDPRSATGAANGKALHKKNLSGMMMGHLHSIARL